MWHGYFLLTKAATFGSDDKSALSVMGDTTPSVPCQCTQVRYSDDDTMALCEMCLAAAPVIGDFSDLSIDSISIQGGGEGMASEGCCAASNAYLIANYSDWTEGSTAAAD